VFYFTLRGWPAGKVALFFILHSPHCLRIAAFGSPPRHQSCRASAALPIAEQQHFHFPNYQMGPVTAEVMGSSQGPPLVNFSAQPESSLSLNPRNTTTVSHKKMATSSQHVDECKLMVVLGPRLIMAPPEHARIAQSKLV
jgi:hypothetical protein